MRNSGTEIDLATWERSAPFALFRSFAVPQYSITTRLDVSGVVTRHATTPEFSSFLACAHAVGAGLSAVPQLRTRIRGAGAVQHDRVRLSPTLRFADGRLGFTYFDWQPDFAAFAQEARAAIDATLALGRMEPGIEGDDEVAFLTCTPWLDFTAFDTPVHGPDDSIPRISWGKFTSRPQGGHDMAVAIKAHHALADGVHLSDFFAAMQAGLDRFTA